MRTASLATLILVACSSGSGGGHSAADLKAGRDMSLPGSSDLVMSTEPDLTMEEMPDLVTPSNCTAYASYGNAGVKTGMSASGTDMSGNAYVTWLAPLDNGMTPDMLSIELY